MRPKSNLVFCCSKYRGDVKNNLENAKRYARYIAMLGYSPVVPHLLFTQFMDDDDPEERIKGIELGIEQLKQCKQMWVFGTEISEGMKYELTAAKKYGIPVRLFDEYLNDIRPETMSIDDRVDKLYVRTVYGQRFV